MVPIPPQILINILKNEIVKNLNKSYQQYTRPKNKKHKHTQQQYNVTYNRFKNLDNM